MKPQPKEIAHFCCFQHLFHSLYLACCLLFSQWLLLLQFLPTFVFLFPSFVSPLSAYVAVFFLFIQISLSLFFFFSASDTQLDIIWTENKWFSIIFSGVLYSLIFIHVSLLNVCFSYLNTFLPLGGTFDLNMRFKTTVTD